MEEYRQVTILGPAANAIKKEPISLENTKSHEGLLYEMLPKRLWQDYSEEKINKAYADGTTFYKIPVNLRAAYVAYKLGFSVIYETESTIIVFVSDYVTEKQIDYIIKTYANAIDKYLTFQTYFKKEEMYTYYENANMHLVNDDYRTVFNDLIRVLNIKKDNWYKEMERIDYAR